MRKNSSTILLKLENMNPGGSHKTRIALSMIRALEDEGVLIRDSGQTILEPTGGNTGLGVAMAAAVLGYKVVLVTPDNYSPSKRKLLAAFGVDVRLSDSSANNNSHGQLALEIQFEHPEYVMLNQAANPANPDIHRRTTGPEILDALEGQAIDVMVAGIGTGGHITGIGAFLKEHMPEMKIIGVQPAECDLLAGRFRRHRLQGLSVGLIPPVLDRRLIDRMVSITEAEAVACMRLLMQREGLPVGPSTGANIAACMKLVRTSPRDTTLLSFAYDGATDYLDLL